MEDNLVICEIVDRLAIVTINNPPVNALNDRVLSELDKLFDEFSWDGAVQVVIITGSGEKAFMAGADIRQFLGLNSDSGKEFVRRGQKVFAKIRLLNQPVIAAINGYALGGGCELAIACDIRIMSENTLIGLPEINLGIIPGFGGTQGLPRLVGPGRAMELICTGDSVKAEEALRIGLVDRLVSVGQVLEEAKTMAYKIMSKGPLSVEAAKKAIQGGIDSPLDKGLLLEAELFASLCSTEDQKEGANAFLAKRQPIFKGK